MSLKEEIKKLEDEFYSLPEKGRVSLGSKGVILLSKIHKLKCKLED